MISQLYLLVVISELKDDEALFPTDVVFDVVNVEKTMVPMNTLKRAHRL